MPCRKKLTTEPSSLVHSCGNIPPLFDLEVMQDVNKKLPTEKKQIHYVTNESLECAKRIKRQDNK